MVRLGPGSVGREVRAVFTTGPVAGLSDAELVRRFVARRDPASFEALVQRHGRMVRGVCRSLLADEHAADDAFQAVFLVLMRRAGQVRVGDSLGRWLHGVALRVARHARAEVARRRRREGADPSGVDPVDAGPAADDAPDRAEALAMLHEELGRLPAAFRAPLVLCHLEGLTHEQAAATLDCPVGTVRSRLARGRTRLRDRLVRRGLAPAAALAAIDGSARGATAVPPALAAATFEVVARHATGRLVVGTAGASLTGAGAAIVSPSVISLTKGALVAMTFGPLKVAGLGVLGTIVLTLGAAAVAQRAGDGPAAKAGAGAASSPHAGLKEQLTLELQQLNARRQDIDEKIANLTRQLRKEPLTLELQQLNARRQDNDEKIANLTRQLSLVPKDETLPVAASSPARVGSTFSAESIGAEIDRLVAERERWEQKRREAQRLVRNPNDPALVATRQEQARIEARLVELISRLGDRTTTMRWAALPAKPAETPPLLEPPPDLASSTPATISPPALALPPAQVASATATIPPPALAAPPPARATASVAATPRLDPAADPFARDEAQALLAQYRLAKGNVGRTALLREKGVISSTELDRVVGEKDVALGRVLDQLRRARDEVVVLGVQKRRQEADISRARAQADLARTQVARNVRLNDKLKGDAFSPEEVAKAEAELKVAEASVQGAEADLMLVMVRLRQAEERVALLEKALKDEPTAEAPKP